MTSQLSIDEHGTVRLVDETGNTVRTYELQTPEPPPVKPSPLSADMLLTAASWLAILGVTAVAWAPVVIVGLVLLFVRFP